MTNPERSKQSEEKEIIKVRQGEPFSLPPLDLSSIEKDYGDIEVIRSFKLEIEGVGTGSVAVKRDKRIFEHKNMAVKTPAGPLEPIYVEIFIDNFPESELEEIRTILIFDGKRFIGCPTQPWEKLTKEPLMFLSWIDSETGEECFICFPPDPDVLSKISFKIAKDSAS